MQSLKQNLPTLKTNVGGWLYGPRRGGAWRERVGEIRPSSPPTAVPRIEIFSGGNSYTAVKYIL